MDDKDQQVRQLREKINIADKKISASKVIGAEEALNQTGATFE